MKKKKSRLIVSLLTAFIMAFTVFPYMGSAGQVSAAEASYEQAWNNPNWGKTKYDFVKTVTFVLKSDNLYDAKVSLDFSKLTSSEFSAIKGSVIRTQWYNTNGGMQTSNFSNAVVGDAKTYEFYSYSGGTRFWFSDLTPGKSIKLRMIVNAFGFDYCPELTISVPAICASGHSWDSGSVTTPATCKVTGLKTLKCTKCNTTKTETIPKSTTHSYSSGKCTVCGAADPTPKVEEVSNKLVATKSGVKKEAGKRVILNGKVYLDSTVDSLELKCQITSSMSGSSTGTWDLKLYDPDGTEIDASYNGNPEKWEDEKFTKAGNYKYELEIEYTGVAELKYEIFMTVKKDIIYTYKYPSLTATATESGMDKVPAVKIEYGEFDGPVTDKLAIFRESNGKIRKLDTSYYTGLVDNIKIDYGTAYTYYIVDLSYVTGTAKTTLSNVGTVDETLTDAIRTALTDSHVTKSNTVTTKSIVVSGVQGLEVYKKGVRTVSLDWGCTYGYDQYLTGYIMQSYNSAGKLMQTKTVERQGFISGESIYIPYAGTSKVTVTPYEDYTDGKRYYGNAQTISVTSAKIAAPGGHVTKISNTNARIAATRYPGASGLQVQQKVGKKWITITSGTTVKEYKKTWLKNKAGKTYYRFRSYIKDQGKTYYSSWKTYAPKSNVGTYTKWSVSYIRNLHGYGNVYFYPTKIQYVGSKIKVTGRFINTWRYISDKGKFKVTFKVDGVSIGAKTIASGTVKANSAKTTTFYLSGAKKNKDLRAAGYSVKTYY